MRLGNQTTGRAESRVAVGGDAVAAGAQIEMGVRSVDGCRDRGVPGQVRAELVFVVCGDHVSLVVVVDDEQAAAIAAVRAGRAGDWSGACTGIVLPRIAHGGEGVRPADA